MSFADKYFLRYKTYPPFSEAFHDTNTDMIVVIPCYDDMHVFNTLSSLDRCDKPDCDVEVIVVVNSSETTPEIILERNRSVYQLLLEKSTNRQYNNFSLLPILIEKVPKKMAGVGNARKVGMDEAIRRFNILNKPEGIIISLDADCLVSKNYFTVIEKAFLNNNKQKAAIFQFKHNFNDNICIQEEKEACKLYELYLRYFRLALIITGYPNAFHTIGSCFALTAETYIKVGGMPKKQGGEDFYFLHKTVHVTEINQLKEVLVFPSPRMSDRVPFGTGPSVEKIMKDKKYEVYNFNLFFILKQFYNELINYSKTKFIEINNFPQEIIEFAGENNIVRTLNECHKNTHNEASLLKRLYTKFDAFFIIKFLNSFTKKSSYPPQDVADSVKLLLDYYRISYINSDLYDKLFELDKSL